MAVTIQKKMVAGGFEVDYPHYARHTPEEAPRLRFGVLKASNFDAVCDPVKRAAERPTLKIARRLWKSMRIVEGGDLSARAWALYYLMLARIGSEWGSEKGEYSISLNDAARFLTERKDRIGALVDAINDTKATFRFEDNSVYKQATLPMMPARIVAKDIVFRPNETYMWSWRRAREYTELELDAVARFRSKYAVQFYPRMARIGGFADDAIRPLVLYPKTLADICRYDWDGHLGNLRSRLIDPIKKDFAAHVRSFALDITQCKDDADKTMFLVEVRPLSRPLGGVKSAPLTEADKVAIRHHRPGLAHTDHPSVSLVARAVTLLGHTAKEIIDSWCSFATTARRETPDHEFLKLVDLHGVATGFARWAEAQPKKETPQVRDNSSGWTIFNELFEDGEKHAAGMLVAAANGDQVALESYLLFVDDVHWDYVFRQMPFLAGDRSKLTFALMGVQRAPKTLKLKIIKGVVEACETNDMMRLLDIYTRLHSISVQVLAAERHIARLRMQEQQALNQS